MAAATVTERRSRVSRAESTLLTTINVYVDSQRVA
jgi:hypothetical protein